MTDTSDYMTCEVRYDWFRKGDGAFTVTKYEEFMFERPDDIMRRMRYVEGMAGRKGYDVDSKVMRVW